ncbi:MAG: peptidoglycan recognition family protein [bacterium]
MKYPFRVSKLDIRHTRPTYIVLHHTWCQYKIPKIKIDTSEYQMRTIYTQTMEQKIPDVNYHYVISKIKDDFSAILCRPFVALCDYPDIDENINRKAIHVALLGNYDLTIPDKRAYEVLAYRVLNPFMKLFSITPARIYLHSELSDNEEETCPGEFFSKSVTTSFVKRFIMK